MKFQCGCGVLALALGVMTTSSGRAQAEDGGADAVCSVDRYIFKQDPSDEHKKRLDDCIQERDARAYVQEFNARMAAEEAAKVKANRARPLPIGSTVEQALKNPDWGAPDRQFELSEGKTVLERWEYESGSFLVFKNGRLFKLFRIK